MYRFDRNPKLIKWKVGLKKRQSLNGCEEKREIKMDKEKRGIREKKASLSRVMITQMKT